MLTILRFFLIYRVHEGRKSYQIQDLSQFSKEKILCLGSSRKQPVLKWENNLAWPGKVTLTDKALYFEVLSSSELNNFEGNSFSKVMNFRKLCLYKSHHNFITTTCYMKTYK